MRKVLLAVAVLALVSPAFAADKFTGSWKMNTQKSSGPEVTPADLVAVDDGDMQTITVTGKNADGSTMTTKFSVPLKGGEGKIIDGAPFTSVMAKSFTSNTEDFTFFIEGKEAMHIHSMLEHDGKAMKTSRRVMSGPGKMGSYVDYWEKQ